MPGPRVVPVPAPYEEGIASAFEKFLPTGMEPLNLFRTLAHNPRVLRRFFAGALLDKGSITLRERELIILRTCARCNCEYEWGVHVALFADHAGFSPDQLAASVHGKSADNVWNNQEVLLISLVDALHDGAGISEDLWSKLTGHWSSEQLIELIVLTGLYHTVSFISNGTRVGLEPFAARFPEPGGH